MGRKSGAKKESAMRNPALMVPMLISAMMCVLMLKSFVFSQVPGSMRHSHAGAPDPTSTGPTMTSAMAAMDHGHMHMDAHMKMSKVRAVKPGDEERAQGIAERTRRAIEKYADYKVALADGYKIFLPNVPQPMYHFTNYWYGFKAGFEFDPEHPTSLLYENSPDGEYKLIGAMFTAPARFSEDQLDQRVPLSITQWHQHVNFCQAPKGREKDYLAPNAKFGLRGSITSEKDCQDAGGQFHPVIFGWMVHVYPFEKDPNSVWAVERQMAHM
jgi:hypothetical protein